MYRGAAGAATAFKGAAAALATATAAQAAAATAAAEEEKRSSGITRTRTVTGPETTAAARRSGFSGAYTAVCSPYREGVGSVALGGCGGCSASFLGDFSEPSWKGGGASFGPGKLHDPES